jgi:AcrR family transcriptional regulator
LTACPRRALRADARRNRDVILAAVGAKLGEHGLAVSLEDIAAAANVARRYMHGRRERG